MSDRPQFVTWPFSSGPQPAWSDSSPTLNRRKHQLRRQSPRRYMSAALYALVFMTISAPLAQAQNPIPNTEALKKTNTRPAEPTPSKRDPFDGATVEKM